MKLRSAWQLVRRWWWMIALYVSVGVVGSLIISAFTTPIYEASTTLVAMQNAAAPDVTDYNSLLGDQQLANTYSQLLHSHPLLQRVASSLDLKMSLEELAKKVRTNVVDNTQLVTLNVEDSTPQRAAAIANALVKEFSAEITARRNEQFASVKTNLQQQLEKMQADMNATETQITQLSDKTGDEDMAQKNRLQGLLDQYATTYDSLLKSYQDVRLTEARSANSLVTAEAQASDIPLHPQPLLDMLLAAIVGIVLSLGVALVAERLDDSVKSPEDITQAVDLTTLGIVSKVEALRALNPLDSLANPRSSVAEAFKMLRTNLDFAQLDHPSRTLLVASSNPGEGRSTVAANLAVGLAHSGKRVILVDTNVRHPALHTFFGVEPGVRGLTTLLLAARGSSAEYLSDTGVEGLRLLQSGPMPPNFAELLQSKRMADLIGELRSQADLVIFDSQPLAAAADAALLGGLCDAVLLVAKAKSTRAGSLQAAKEQLSQAGARILGVVLNHVAGERSSGYYYYDYHYGPSLGNNGLGHESVAGQALGREAGQAREHEGGQARGPAPTTALQATADGASFFTKMKHLSGLSLIYVIADIISRGSAILLVPLYTRFMAPSDYGILALASLISSLLVMLLTFGGPSVVQRFYHQYSGAYERAQLLGSFWLFLIIVPGIAIGAMLVFGDAIFGTVFNSLPLHPYIELILCISYLNVAFGTVLPSLFRAREQAMRYLGLSSATMFLTVGFTVYLVVFRGMGAVGALGAQFAALDIMAVVSSILLVRELARGWVGAGHAPPLQSGQPLGKTLKYGLPLIPHFAAHWTLSISDRAILERFVGLNSVGLYSLAYQFGTVLQMLFTSVNQALTPAFSRAARDKREFATLGRIATYYYLAVAVLGLLVAMMAKDMIVLLTPPAYHSAGELVPYIALGIVAMGFYFIPMNALSMTAGKTTVIPFITLAAGATNVLLNLFLVPRLGPLAAAIDTAVGYGVLAVLTTAYARSVVPLQYEVTRIIRIIAGSALIYAARYFVNTGHPLANLALSVLLVACLPLVLACLGFWTDSEKARLATLLRSSRFKVQGSRSDVRTLNLEP